MLLDEIPDFVSKIRANLPEYTIKQICEAIGLDPKSITNYESGSSPVSSKYIVGLVEFFGVSPTYILTGQGEMFTKDIDPNELSPDDFKNTIRIINLRNRALEMEVQALMLENHDLKKQQGRA